MANPTSFTGEIGVIIQSLKYKDLLDKIGVAPVTFKSGEFKDMLSGAREMTDAEKEYVQKLVMQTYGLFVSVVAKERKISEVELREGIADGRVVSGIDALEAKLVDSLGAIEDAYEKARELGEAPDAPVVSYNLRIGFGQLLDMLGSEESKAGLHLKLLPLLEPGRAYWLPGFYAME